MNNNNFLPDGYLTPQTVTGYTKFPEGETRIRILSKPLMFWEEWENKEVKRFPFINNNNKPSLKARHCWCMKVYNYVTKQMEVCSIHQITIKLAIENLCRDADYGNPFEYDIKVVRKGKDLNDTEYSVIPSPPKPVTEEVKKAFVNCLINLDAMLTGESPFLATNEQTHGKEEPVKAQSIKENSPAETDAEGNSLPF